MTKIFIVAVVVIAKLSQLATAIAIFVMIVNFKFAETMIHLTITMRIPFVIAFNLVINLEISKLVDFILLVYCLI